MKAFAQRIIPIILIFGWTIPGCSTVLVLQADPTYLDVELSQLPARNPIAMNVEFLSESETTNGLVSGRTSKYGERWHLHYPDKVMLRQAGQTAMRRWFTSAGSRAPSIVVYAKIVDLYYWNNADTGSNQAVVAVRVQVRTLYQGRERHVDVYSSAEQRGERFGMTWAPGVGKKFEQHFSRAVYKALLITLDKAMADLVLHVPELRNRLSAEEQKLLETIRDPQSTP